MERVCLIIPWPCCEEDSLCLVARPTRPVLLGGKIVEFYDLSGKNGIGSGLCQARPNCCSNSQMRAVKTERVRSERDRTSLV